MNPSQAHWGASARALAGRRGRNLAPGRVGGSDVRDGTSRAHERGGVSRSAGPISGTVAARSAGPIKVITVPGSAGPMRGMTVLGSAGPMSGTAVAEPGLVCEVTGRAWSLTAGGAGGSWRAIIACALLMVSFANPTRVDWEAGGAFVTRPACGTPTTTTPAPPPTSSPSRTPACRPTSAASTSASPPAADHQVWATALAGTQPGPA